MGRKIKVTMTVDVDKLSRAGGHARAAAMLPEERAKAASKASQARWAAYYAEHPEKRKTARTGASRKKTAKKKGKSG
jgi:hypothetical protein